MALKLTRKPASEPAVYDPYGESDASLMAKEDAVTSADKKEEEDSATAAQYTKAANLSPAPQVGGSGTMQAGGSLMAAAPMTGAAAPYVFGAGAALSTYAAIKKGEEEEANAEYLAKLKKIENTQNSLSQLMQASQGLRSL
jgi:hypothetical protein